MRVRKRGAVAVLLALALILAGMPLAPAKEAEAAKKMKLSKTKLSLNVGKTKKLTVKNKKKKAKVTWSSSKKKVATVSKKGVVKAKKAGKATITAKVKYKKKTTKLKCKVTVTKKKKGKETPKPTATGEATAKPTAKPTEKATAKPTEKPTEKPTAKPTAEPTKTPGTGTPEPDKAIPWDEETMGGFYVSGIRFEDDTLTYKLGDKEIGLDLGDQYTSVKEAVPDLSKCIFEVYAGKERYTGVKAADIQWKDSRDGKYEFSLYIKKDGKTWSSDWEMCEAGDDDGGYFDNELLITAIRSGGKTIVPQREMPYGSNHYIIDPQGANVKADLPDLKTAEFTATYMGKEITIEKISNVKWVDRSYYDDWDGGTGYYRFDLHIRNGAQKEAFTLYLSDGKDRLEICRYTYLLDGKETLVTAVEDSDVLSVEIPEGKTLKEVWSDPSASFAFNCLYKDKVYEQIRPSDVNWVAEPYHDNKCDKGYYTFKLSTTVNGKTVSREYKLVEKYRGITYRISGKLSDADGANPPAGQKLKFENRKTYEKYTATTGESGSYAVDLPEGSYDVFWDNCPLSKVVKVEKQAMTVDIATRLKKASGTITRLGKPMADCDIRISLYDFSYSDPYVFCHTDQNGGYTVYLPQNGTADMKLYANEESARENIGGMTLIDYDSELLEKIHQNHNITINKVKISGKIYRKETTSYAEASIRFIYKDEDDNSWSDYGRTKSDGSYEMYLNPDRIYELWADEDEIQIEQAVQIGKADLTRDFRMDAVKIRGTLKTKSGIAVPHHRIGLYLQGNEEPVTTYTDSKGKYSLILKQGTYTVKDMIWKTESDQKLTVGNQDQVLDLTVPLYQVEIAAYNNNEPWNSDMYVEQGGEMRDVIARHTEDNKFAMYVPAGTYTCNIVDSTRNAKTVTVTDRDITPELWFTHQKVTGNIYHLASGTYFGEFPGDTAPCLYIKDEEGNSVDYLYASWKKYETYLPGAGTYKVTYQNKEVFSFTTGSESEITQDLICKVYKVTGMMSGGWAQSVDNWSHLRFMSDEGHEYETFLGDKDDTTGTQAFTAHLPAGDYTYQASYNGSEKEGELSVSGDQSDFNIAMPVLYEISGIVTRLSKPFKGAYVECREEDDEGNEVNYSCAVTDADGSYKIYVPEGTYKLSVQDDPQRKEIAVTVSDRDQVKNLAVDLVKISGTVTRKGNKLPNVPVECRKKGEEDTCASTQTGDYGDEKGKYSFYVAPDASYEISVLGEKEELTVAREDRSLDFVVTATKVSGTVTEAEGSDSSGNGIEIYQKDDEGNWINYYHVYPDWEGTYECYLPAGKYYVSYWIQLDDDGNGFSYECGTITVGTEDITYNIQKKALETLKHTVSGTLSGEAGTPWAGVDITFDSNNTVTTDENGQYTVTLYGDTHTYSLVGMGIENLTVESENMTHNIQFKGYVKISGILTENGAAVSGTNLDILVEGMDEEVPIMSSCCTKEDGSYTFIVPTNNQYKIVLSSDHSLQAGEVINVETADIDNNNVSLSKKE